MKAAVRKALTLRESAPPRAAELAHRGDLLWIEAEYLAPDPFQPRKHFDEDTLVELGENITEFGILTPMRVRPAGDDGLHFITDGERRWRAGQLVGVVAYPCLVEAADTNRAFLEAYLANLHRDSLAAVDAAVGLEHIRETFQLASDDDVAHRINKSVGWVRQMNAVLSLDPESRQLLQERQEPIAVAVGLRPQSPAERHATLEAIIDLPSRDRKVGFIGRVNDLRRAGHAIDDAIATASAATSDAHNGANNGTSARTPQRSAAQLGGRPTRITLPFTWRDIGNGIAYLDVAPSALATTKIAARKTVPFDEWRDALVADLTAFRDSCADAEHQGDEWESLRESLSAVLGVESQTQAVRN